ncbi:MAG: tetratricopeptide repeat protein [candidate division Zixibacteria bacterium]|nr:tetratricopeptide repeat protein [candidate division Zixibacteria bacterium]
MDYKNAAEIRLAVKANPDDPNILREAAEYFLSVELYDESMKYWADYNRLVGGDPDAHKIIGALKGRIGNHQKAKEHFEKALALRPDDPDTHYNLSLTLLNLGDITGSINHLAESVKLNPRDLTAWNNLGVLLFETKNRKEAEKCFLTCLNIDPFYRDAYLNLAQFEGQFENPDEVIRYFRTYLDIHKEDELLKAAYEVFKPRDEPRESVNYNGIKVSLAAFSDFETDPERKLRWGDYWFKKEFSEAFERLGCEVVENNADLLLHLFGVPMNNLPSAKTRAIWIHSHPDMVSAELLNKYDKVFCLSEPFIPRIKSMGFDAELLIGGTGKKPVEKAEKKYDLVFVGNTKGKYGRRIIRDLGGNYQGLKVWGEGWEHILPPENIEGIYFENQKLPELYASTKISLNDHHDDMLREGFLNPRVFDILASGGFVISDKMTGMDKLFEGAVPTYETPEELQQLIDKYLNDDKAREELSARGRQIALKYSFDYMASQVMKSIYGDSTDAKTGMPAKKMTFKRSAERKPVNVGMEHEKQSCVFGIDVSGREEYEVLPIINGFRLVHEFYNQTRLQVIGNASFDIGPELEGNANIENVHDLSKCDVFIDCCLKYTGESNTPENTRFRLTPNLEDEYYRGDDCTILRINTQKDIELGRIWEFNDLAFKLGFAAENLETIISKYKDVQI